MLEAAVIGLPDEHSGEAVTAFVVRKDDTLTAEALRAFCKDNLTGYKVPKQIIFRESLPKTNVGKVLRRALREEVGRPGMMRSRQARLGRRIFCSNLAPNDGSSSGRAARLIRVSRPRHWHPGQCDCGHGEAARRPEKVAACFAVSSNCRCCAG